jgi:hypothetical protein
VGGHFSWRDAGVPMTAAERDHLRTIVSRQRERAEIREALALSNARASIDRMLGEELIAAGREVVSAWRERRNLIKTFGPSLIKSLDRLNSAIAKLEKLVGSG